jgi:hypothetical protein
MASPGDTVVRDDDGHRLADIPRHADASTAWT